MFIRAAIRFAGKYKIVHIVFWTYSILAFMHLRQELDGGSLLSYLPTTLLIKLFQIIGVYFTIYFLLPRYLNHNKYLQFFFYTIAFIILCAVVNAYAIEFLITLTHGIHSSNILVVMLSLMIDILIITSVFLAVTIIYSRYETDQRNRQLEKERLETELNFLKAQINPHFLFNAINSIYVLIDLDKKVASETLLKFSGLLRYQLYECAEDTVDIERELSFLNDYIGLETLRKEKHLEVKFDTSQQLKYFKITPFLLIPFVENAFKHVSHNSENKNYIHIKATFADHTFSFSVSNSFDGNVLSKNGGIGLQNVKRRLELLYPEKHALKIEKQKNIYAVKLELNGN